MAKQYKGPKYKENLKNISSLKREAHKNHDLEPKKEKEKVCIYKT